MQLSTSFSIGIELYTEDYEGKLNLFEKFHEIDMQLEDDVL